VTLVGMFLVTEAGLLLATLNAMLYDRIIPQGDMTDLVGFSGIIIACMIGSLCFGISKNIATFRNTSKVSYALQSAILNRLFHMPEKFFRSYESALLSYRVERLSGVYISMYMCLIQILLQGGFSLLYCRRMYAYSPALARVGLLFVLLNVITSAVIGQVFNEYSTDKSRARGQLRTFLYQTVTGISGVRLMGAEEDVQGEYVDKYVDYINADRKYSLSQRLAPVVSILITGVSTVLMYFLMVNTKISVSIGSFMGFTAAYAAFSGAMAMVGNNAMQIYSSLPTLKESADVLRMQPDQYGSGKILQKVTGKIDIDRVSFAYQKDGKPVLRNIDLHIRPGEYVAITGRSGCGKSTLLRLLLGFEQPSSGMIYYDDIGMDRLNIPELRRRMGVVLQDGGLISGSILDNIKAGNRDLTNEELDRILDEVGLKEDIHALQMGILTPISEEWSTISGGQKQRILIARAIAGNPDILLMDEATSSLDNITQKYVCESLEKHHITRIVIAHRLSTVVNCDRIIVMDNGQIREQGTYEELMARKGVFYQLAVDQT
jgi:ATP-binding cassette subfamily C protein